jgi:hypothetical protein
MKPKMIKEILERAKDWPESALAELAQIALGRVGRGLSVSS